METYTSIIIDIRKSRDYDLIKRNELQRYLMDATEILNTLFHEEVVFNLTFSAGDELQGLFNDTIAAIRYLRLLEIMVHPVQIRAGIGIGEWNVKIEGASSTAQDGPAYHNARYAINEVKRMQTQRFRIYSNSQNDIMSNYLLNTSKNLLEDQNDMQNRYQIICELMYPFVTRERDNGNGNLLECSKELLRLKESFQITKKPIEQPVIASINDFIIEEEIVIPDFITEPEKSVFKKNYAANLTMLCGKSRQNAEKITKRGNVMLIRCMDYVALHYIKKHFGGYYDL